MKLRRITTQGNWIPEIDGLRFVAIAATLLTHILGETVLRGGSSFSAQASTTVPALVESGGRGVLLFFAISGFILGQPFLRQHLQHGKPVSIKAFFKRRLTRLEPPYILSLLIYAVATAIFQHHARPLVLPLLAHIVYLHNFTHLQPISFVTWSLEVEVQFYILAPLLGLLFAIPSSTLRRTAITALILASAVFHYTHHGVASWNLPGQLQFFLVGFLLADLRATRTHSTTSRWWDLVSVVVWVAIFALPSQPIAFLLSPLILLAYLAAFNGPASRQVFRTTWIAIAGGMCYSFYLMHMLIISIAFRLTRHLIVPSSLALSFLIQAVLLGACVTVVCTAYFVLIERPCMDPNWPRKLSSTISRLRRPRPTAVAETTAESI